MTATDQLTVDLLPDSGNGRPALRIRPADGPALVVDLADVRYLVDALNRGAVLILDQLQADQRRAAMEARQAARRRW